MAKMASVYKILIVIILLLFLNQNAFSRKKSFLRFMRIRHEKKATKHSRTGAKKTINTPSNIQPRTNANDNTETNKLLLAALYGGLGMGVASTENFDYTNGLNSKIQLTGGYGIPPGIYSYAFDPKTGMPYMCDPTKSPAGGVSQVTAATAVQPPAAAAKPPPATTTPAKSPPAATAAGAKPPPATTTPAKSPPAATVGRPPVYQADKMQNQLGNQTPGTNTQGEATPGKITQEQQQLVASANKGKGGLSDSKNQQRISPINDMTGSMTTDNPAKHKEKNGPITTPPGKAATLPGKAATPLVLQTQNTNEDGDLMASMSPSNSKNDAKNNDDEDDQTPTPPGNPGKTSSLSTNGMTLFPSHVTSPNDKVKSPGSKIVSSGSATGSATGIPIFVKNPKLNPSQTSTASTTNTNKVTTGVKLTPLIANSHHSVKPITTKQKSFNPLTKLIKEQKYKTLKRNMVNIKLPDIPACPDMKQYHWPWNCLENGKGNSIKRECIQNLQQIYSYPAYSNQLPYAGFADYSSEQPDTQYPSQLPYNGYYKR